ncbi:MAG: DCC1-like thiol-disulfide oxidoreductase family protein [Planctomycetota bacterium]
MKDEARHPEALPSRVLLYDGTCGLCHRSVRFVLRHERTSDIHFAALQSTIGETMQRDHELDPTALSTVVLIDTGNAYTRSSAVVHVARSLRAPWSWLRFGRWIPAPVRDLLYRFVARIRYPVFGRAEGCPLPDPAQRHRFLDM